MGASLLCKILIVLAAFLAVTVDAFTAPKPAFSRQGLAREWPRMASGPATLEPETIEKVKEDKKEQSAGTKQPAWEVSEG